VVQGHQRHPGATGPSLYFLSPQLDDAGTYYAEVTNSSGSVYSTGATLNVIATVPSLGSYPITTIAGSPLQAGSANGVGTNARFNSPNGIAIDQLGTIYVADEGNHIIRKILPNGTSASTCPSRFSPTTSWKLHGLGTGSSKRTSSLPGWTSSPGTKMFR
jgi:hypothetical protein